MKDTPSACCGEASLRPDSLPCPVVFGRVFEFFRIFFEMLEAPIQGVNEDLFVLKYQPENQLVTIYLAGIAGKDNRWHRKDY